MPLSGTSPAPRAPGRRRLLLGLATSAALVAVLVYLNALDNPFVFDDYRLIVENPSIQNLSDIQTVLFRDVTRPIVNLSYALDTAVWGRSPFGYHLTNVILHAVNVILVFWVALLASEDRRRQWNLPFAAGLSSSVVAYSTALLFAVHPMLTQAVGYVSGRSEVAYGCFFLLAFLAGRRWMLQGGKRWWFICGALWLGAVLSKESALMLPFVLVAYDWLVLDTSWPERRRRLVRMALPLVTLALTAAIGRLAILGLVEYEVTMPDWRFALVAADAFWGYLSMFAVPKGQSIFHALPLYDDPFAPRALASAIGVGAFLAGIWFLRRVHSLVAFGALWFLLLLVPSSALFVLGIGEPMAEHRAYVAAVGLFLAGGSAFAVLWNRVATRAWARGLVYAISVLFIGQLGARTIVRNVIWGDPIALSREAAGLAPDQWMPRMLLGEAYRQNGQCGEAIVQYRAAIARRPQQESPYPKLAGCLVEGHRFDEAEMALLQLRAVNPDSQEARMGLGLLAILHNRAGESRQHFLDVLEGNPSSPQAQQLLAFIDGTLPAAEHLQLCQQMYLVMKETFDTDACMHWQREPDESVAVDGP